MRSFGRRLAGAPVGMLLAALLVVSAAPPWAGPARAQEEDDSCLNSLCLAVELEADAFFEPWPSPLTPSSGGWWLYGQMRAVGLSPQGLVDGFYHCWGWGAYNGTTLSMTIHDGSFFCHLVGGFGPFGLAVERLSGPILGGYASLNGFLSDGVNPPVILSCEDPWFFLVVLAVALVVEGCSGKPEAPVTVTCVEGEVGKVPLPKGSRDPTVESGADVVKDPKIEAVSTESGEAAELTFRCEKAGTATIKYVDARQKEKTIHVKVTPKQP